MTPTLRTALLAFALGAAATAPALADNARAPRAGAPTAVTVDADATPYAQRPRAGAAVAIDAPASTELASSGALILSDVTEPAGAASLCGRKYCGGASAPR